MPTNGSTPNFDLILPYSGRQNWVDLANGNFKVIDAILATFVSVTNLQGIWTNNTAYTIGDNVVDENSGVVYTAQVNHTSSGAPTTFLEERTNNPTYWLTFAVAARNRGAWQTNTAYALNDFVLAGGTKYAMAIQAHTSGANFNTDLAAGKWEVMIDLSAAGSLVLPVLSGAADADKAVTTNSAGTSYVIQSMTAMASLLNAAGLATLANPTFSGNPIAPTQTAEDNDTSIATTQYADRAVRALVPRVQTFTGNGTYTPHAKLVYGYAVGKGGGSGGGGLNVVATFDYGASGGGEGNTITKVFTAASVTPNVSVTIGGGGAGGVAGAAGGAGGDTTFGALLTAKGATAASTFVCGAANTVGNVGDFFAYGATGGASTLYAHAAGNIGCGATGGGAGAGAGGISGTPGSAFNGANAAANSGGGGGGGGSCGAGPGSVNGGNGGSGYLYVVEFCYG